MKHNKSQLYSAKANLDTIDQAVKTQLSTSVRTSARERARRVNHCLANVKLTGIMQTSATIAHSLAELMKVEQLQAISAQFSSELIKVDRHGRRLRTMHGFLSLVDRWASWAK